MKNIPLESSQPLGNSFKIKGRMIPNEETVCRVKNYCNSLGFGSVTFYSTASCPAGFVEAGSEKGRWAEEEDVVLVSSIKVAYNPHWGGYGGHPHLLHHAKSAHSAGASPAEFIAPFLHWYRYAQEHMVIGQTEAGGYHLTVPVGLLKDDGQHPGCRLKIHLEKIVEVTKDGKIVPAASFGAFQSFALASSFRQSLAGCCGDGIPGRQLPIGNSLDRRMFSYTIDDKAFAADNPYVATLLPHICEIVSHPTPNLRAAQIHLQQIFIEDMARLAAEQRTRSGKLLYLAGLDIDMSEFAEGEEHYFVPWQAYIALGGQTTAKEFLVAQDDLFVQLKQQDKHCLA